MEIGDRLNELLSVLKLNANQFAKELGYERPEKIYDILNKKFKPSFETLMDILMRFEQVNADWLLRGEGNMFKEEQPVTGDVSGNSLEAQKMKWLETQIVEKDKQLADKERIIAILEKQIALLEKLNEFKK